LTIQAFPSLRTPHFLEIPEGRPITADEKYRHKPRDWMEHVQDLADGKADRSIAETGDVLVFMHGYNNALEEIRQRHELLLSDLAAEGWRGQRRISVPI